MSKMSELEMAVRDLRSAAATISEVASTLEALFSSPVAEQPPTPEKPAPTLEDVRAVLAEKSRMGFTAQIRSMLQAYGATKLSQIDPSHYEGILAEAEVLGDAG